MDLKQLKWRWRLELGQAFESLMQHKLRTTLTLLGMIFGVGAVISMLNIGKGAEEEALKLIDSMGLRNIIVKNVEFSDNKLKEIRESSMGLTLQDLNASVETLPFLDSYSALKKISSYSIISDYGSSDASVTGVTPSHNIMASIKLKEGRFILPVDDMHYSRVCVIGSSVASSLFPDMSPVGKSLKINHIWFRVVGVIADKEIHKKEFQGVSLTGNQNSIYLPVNTGLNTFRFKPLESELDEFRIKLKKGVPASVAAITLEHLLSRRHRETKDYELVVPEALMEQHRKTQRIFTIVMACVAGISLLVGGIGIMNIMLATVLERTKEIGLRRAIGATQADIKRQFVTETFAVSLSGGALGILFGFLLSVVIAGFAGWPVGWSLWSIVLSFGVCAVIGVVFGLYPAVQASKLDPINALRHD